MFSELALPHLTAICSAFKVGGAVANFLHINGPTEAIYPYYPYYPWIDAAIANVDYCNDLPRVQQLLPGRCLLGNVTL